MRTHLQPVNELVPASLQLPVLGVRARSGIDENGGPTRGGVVDRSGESLSPAIDVDDDGSRQTAHLSIALSS